MVKWSESVLLLSRVQHVTMCECWWTPCLRSVAPLSAICRSTMPACLHAWANSEQACNLPEEEEGGKQGKASASASVKKGSGWGGGASHSCSACSMWREKLQAPLPSSPNSAPTSCTPHHTGPSPSCLSGPWQLITRSWLCPMSVA